MRGQRKHGVDQFADNRQQFLHVTDLKLSLMYCCQCITRYNDNQSTSDPANATGFQPILLLFYYAQLEIGSNDVHTKDISHHRIDVAQFAFTFAVIARDFQIIIGEWI